MAVRHLEGLAIRPKGPPKDAQVRTSDLKTIVSSGQQGDYSSSHDAFPLKNTPESPKRSDGQPHHVDMRRAHRDYGYGYSLPILTERTNQLPKFESLELCRGTERGAKEDGQKSWFGKAKPARSPRTDGANSRISKGNSVLQFDTSPAAQLPLQCRSMPLTLKDSEKCTSCSRQMAFNPMENHREPLPVRRLHYNHPPALRCGRRFAPGSGSMLDHPMSGGGDVAAKSRLPTQLSEPSRRPTGSRRSLGDHQRIALSSKKSWGFSAYSEPIGSRGFTYIDRVLRWLRKVPSNPLVNKIDCDGMAYDKMVLPSHQAPATTRLSHPGSAWLQPSRADLLCTPMPSRQSPPIAVVSPRRSTPRDETSVKSVLYRPVLSPVGPLSGELVECNFDKSSPDSQFYPLNFMPSTSHEKDEDAARFLDMSPRPPNPSPCSTKCPSMAENAPRRTTGRKYSYGSVEELSFNSAECTHDALSVNEFVSPEPPEPPEPKLVPTKTLMIDVLPTVSVRYRKQKQVVKVRHTCCRRASKPRTRVASHAVVKCHKRGRKKATLPLPAAKCDKKPRPRRTSKKKKKTKKRVSDIEKCIRLIRRKPKKPKADESEFVLRDLSPPGSVSSGASLTIAEAFQRVVSMTAQLKLHQE